MGLIQDFQMRLDKKIEEKHLLNHPFYQAWSKGALSKECLQEYAKDYYHHVRAFPTYLSALHSHTLDSETRREILNNLIEEEAGNPNHPDLWKAFTLSLGVTQKDIEEHQPSPEMKSLIDTFNHICREKSVAEGLAALYSYESQIPPICISKIEGLKKHYDLQNPQSWRYFSLHIEADEKHSSIERELLSKHVLEENALDAEKSAEKILDCLWKFLSSLCMRYEIQCV